MATTTPKVITLKLLIDSKEKMVLFAEAGKDFTDFLFSLLSIPVGTVIRLLSTKGMVGTLGNLYQSLQNLGDTYIQTNVDKNILLKPKCATLGGSSTLFSLTNDDTTSKQTLYLCDRCYNYGSDVSNATCPSCCCTIGRVVNYVLPMATQVGGSSSFGAEVEGGFVKGVVTYMIMDDLQVKPMSTISSIAMLNTFNVKEVGALQEKTVTVGINEGLNILKASLQTKRVLTHVFLGNNK
ncbi:uncharacterized protein LOC133031572 [Cannabis sativa]|uniref:uncharacterized protein LOC133031572 n=1 Tax=Cannabis sativa TaxID=3483 RepID=UPI0029CAA4E4|nr:uncharacterized protein LOC133031572 [Cannabis sativa]